MGEGFLYGCCCSEIAPFTLRAKLRAEQHIQVSTLLKIAAKLLQFKSCALWSVSKHRNEKISRCSQSERAWAFLTVVESTYWRAV